MKQVVFVGLIGLLSGIVLGEWRGVSTELINLFVILSFCFTLIAFIDRSLFTLQYRAVLMFTFMCALGLLRTGYAYMTLPPPVLDERVGMKQIMTVQVVSAIDARDTSVSFVAKPLEDSGSLKGAEHVPYIQINADRFADVSYGDIVRIEGILKSIVSHSKTYERVGESYIRKGVLYKMEFPKMVLIEHHSGNFFKHYSIATHDWIKSTIITYVPEPSAGFINGILIGEKHGLSKEWYDAFMAVGLTHVIVLSGYNLTVVFAWIRILLRRTSFIMQNSFGALGVVILVLVSGAEAPAVRAGILVLIVALAAVLHRQQDSAYFLSLVILCMLLVNPFYLLYDISFQLSVAATYGLVYLAPIVQDRLKHFPKILAEVIRDTSAAQVAVLPLQLFYFGTLSWVALFVNIIFLPFIPLLMISGVLILATSFMPGVSLLIGACTGIVSDGVLFLVKIISTTVTPIAISITLSSLVIAYTALIFLIVKYKKV